MVMVSAVDNVTDFISVEKEMVNDNEKDSAQQMLQSGISKWKIMIEDILNLASSAAGEDAAMLLKK